MAERVVVFMMVISTCLVIVSDLDYQAWAKCTRTL
jgi:hypothetical protein